MTLKSKLQTVQNFFYKLKNSEKKKLNMFTMLLNHLPHILKIRKSKSKNKTLFGFVLGHFFNFVLYKEKLVKRLNHLLYYQARWVNKIKFPYNFIFIFESNKEKKIRYKQTKLIKQEICNTVNEPQKKMNRRQER